MTGAALPKVLKNAGQNVYAGAIKTALYSKNGISRQLRTAMKGIRIMHVILRNGFGDHYQISTSSAKLIGEWMQQYIPLINNHSERGMFWTIQIYTENKEESRALGSNVESTTLKTVEGWTHLKNIFVEAEKRMLEQ